MGKISWLEPQASWRLKALSFWHSLFIHSIINDFSKGSKLTSIDLVKHISRKHTFFIVWKFLNGMYDFIVLLIVWFVYRELLFSITFKSLLQVLKFLECNGTKSTNFVLLVKKFHLSIENWCHFRSSSYAHNAEMFLIIQVILSQVYSVHKISLVSNEFVLVLYIYRTDTNRPSFYYSWF